MNHVISEQKNGIFHRHHIVAIEGPKAQKLLNQLRRAMHFQMSNQRRKFKYVGEAHAAERVLQERKPLRTLVHVDPWEFAEYAGYDHRNRDGRLDGRGEMSFDPMPKRAEPSLFDDAA